MWGIFLEDGLNRKKNKKEWKERVEESLNKSKTEIEKRRQKESKKLCQVTKDMMVI